MIFNNEEFGEIRTTMINNEPWFVGKDVCERLGYKNGSRDIRRHVDSEDIFEYQNGTLICESKRGNKKSLLINESGLYALIFGSGKNYCVMQISNRSEKHNADVQPST